MTTFQREFTLNPTLASLPSSLPDPASLAKVLASTSRRGRQALAGLWLSEGVPFAFSLCPALYEELRAWVAARIAVHSKEITLVGSGRTGYSLVPRKFGNPFREESDLDVVAVSLPLFLLLEKTVAQFSDDLASGAIAPRNDTEAFYWKENVKFANLNAPRGFLDANKIPTLDRYPLAQRMNNAMALLVRHLGSSVIALRVRRASLRVYRDWPSFISRLSFNLFDLGQKLTSRS